ncbi:PepSY domain-containing protein [Siminovitchia terrae]|uniref:PepSY domain-containing protein n=1 Tax=Siminovitchia terrae TaxID=1914933 RepID=UPI001AFCD5A8|nr:hypothetical protein [Siminovitchia terrae]GIN91014.1 hypothetical protein J22TS1_20650 [Siminovitchia terrae]
MYYYLVEVERDKEKEATVQINAITGEVLSITWDDESIMYFFLIVFSFSYKDVLILEG